MGIEDGVSQCFQVRKSIPGARKLRVPSLPSELNGSVMENHYMPGFTRTAAANAIYFLRAHKDMQEIYASIWSNLQGAFGGGNPTMKPE